MPQQSKQPVQNADADRKQAAAGNDIRARLLKMIVANEQARKPKSQ